MRQSLKALSALLTYPTAELAAAIPEVRGALAEDRALPERHLAALAPLLTRLASRETIESEEIYVGLFDRSRMLSLHLFEHVHGESRDRGQAMVDLLKLYEEGGYTPTPSELPDFLPLFLEFASTREPRAAIDLIGQPADVIAALRERLAKRNSPYEAVMAALLALSKADRKSVV